MPELAEVEYYRKCWNAGIGDRIKAVHLDAEKRIFRGSDLALLQSALPGAVFLRSEARGKQLLFGFSRQVWLGVHLGMTGKLSLGPPDLVPGKHDHFVLFQSRHALVFSDPRLFGRVQFHQGPSLPDWWTKLPPDVNSRQFTRPAMERFLRAHPRLPIKAALLLQSGFAGIGNWMADEILWRSRLQPETRVGDLSAEQEGLLWKQVRFVARGAMKHVSADFSDPPASWLFHERWSRTGRCPIHRCLLRRATIGGRTTVWCRHCQA